MSTAPPSDIWPYEPVRVGLVGAGPWARAMHAKGTGIDAAHGLHLQKLLDQAART
ncbi:hypothetical protein [Streptomyces atroolivaceus]|uniref:hypothetical protein n=1 Tax=Streptomyces atroolivaceus TaxID=66869 RepID=UPI00363B2A39